MKFSAFVRGVMRIEALNYEEIEDEPLTVTIEWDVFPSSLLKTLKH